MRLWRLLALLLILLLAACSSGKTDQGSVSQSSAANGKSIIVYKSPT